MVTPLAVSVSSQDVGNPQFRSVTSSKTSAVMPADALKVASAKRFVSLNGSGMLCESAIASGVAHPATSEAEYAVKSNGVVSEPSNGTFRVDCGEP